MALGSSTKSPMITEGQLSGLVNDGLVVGEASPEAAAGGPLAFIENGDMIAIDVRAQARRPRGGRCRARRAAQNAA